MGRPVKGSVAACFEVAGSVWRVAAGSIGEALSRVLAEAGGSEVANQSGVLTWLTPDGLERRAWVTVQDMPLPGRSVARWLQEVR